MANRRLTLKMVDRYPYAGYKRHAITSVVTAVASEANRNEAEFSPRASEQDQRHADLIRPCATGRKHGLGAIAGLSA